MECAPACRRGEENTCDFPRTLGIYQDGGYSDFIRVPSYRYLVRLDNIDMDASASLACSGLTAFSAVKKVDTQAGDTLVFIGAGGLGLMGVQIVKAVTNARIIIVDVDNRKLAEAKKLGADDTINSREVDPVRAIKDVTTGLGSEAIIDFVNNNKTAPNSIDVLRKRGRLVMVGLFGGVLELDLAMVPLKALTLTGSYTGKFADLLEQVYLAKAGEIRSVVSKTFKLDQANEALEDLKAGKIIGRAVLRP